MRRKISKIINDYNICEKKEILNTSFQFRKFFSPLTHYKLSDPIRLESIDQLAFFFDIFHDQS